MKICKAALDATVEATKKNHPGLFQMFPGTQENFIKEIIQAYSERLPDLVEALKILSRWL